MSKINYYKNEKMSQIDLVLTNSLGKSVKSFKIVDSNWHLADHRPVNVNICVDSTLSCNALLVMAQNWNHEYSPYTTTIQRFNKSYDFQTIDNYIQQKSEAIFHDIGSALNEGDIEVAVSKFDILVKDMHQCAKIPKPKITRPDNTILMDEANEKFKKYCENLVNGSNADIRESLDEYQTCRKNISHVMLREESEKWRSFTNDKGSKDMWSHIDWKGNVRKNKLEVHPTINELKTHFETVYTAEDQYEIEKINQLSTEVYIPVLDDPIGKEEIQDALKDCKKGGFDFTVEVLMKLVSSFLPLFLLLFNCIFYLYYPFELACSLLFTIPKKGNLKLPSNFRGIQMLKTLGVLYDRILSRRLDRWINIHDEQTGFRKGKSTVTQLFTLRLLIEMAKKTETTLYIGCFDIEKAFDKVSRFLLLKKLIKCGVGFAMFNALKSIYTRTTCILNFNGKNSQEFRTSSGIRQGAPSSSCLFIIFINDLIDYIRIRCISEPLIDVMHVLLHADDTLIISTNRILFIRKCNFMLDYFHENKLRLNLGKSSYLIINAKNIDKKSTVILNNGPLEYKSEIMYLGLVFSDKGSLNNDIKLNVRNKRGNITVKYTNFCARNFCAPINVKFKVLHSCVISSLCYGSETWGGYASAELETTYRMGLKTALSVRFSTCDDIVYIESGAHPITCSIKKRQIKFWLSINENLDPNNSLSKLIQKAKDVNLQYINYYVGLVAKYESAINCESTLKSEHRDTLIEKIRAAHEIDADSKLGTYLQVNPSLESPIYKDDVFEIERIHITRFRTGSHNLLIETGRFVPGMNREMRICSCGNGVQSLRHVLMECSTIANMENSDVFANTFTTVEEFFKWQNLHDYLVSISKALKIEL